MSGDRIRSLEGTPPDLWDAVVRLTHWSIAVVVVGNQLVTEGGSLAHVWLGWLGMGFLLIRFVWGFVGPPEARFVSFPLRPGAALRHLRELAGGRPREYRSHNPAGAAMVYALWTTLAAVIVSGLVLTGGATPMEVARQQAAVASGDWAALVSEEPEDDDADGGPLSGRKQAEEFHELASNLLLLLVVLHLGGVAAESLALRRNLLRPMLTGRNAASAEKRVHELKE